MTVPAHTPRNWCPVCHETCVDHARVCTVCGTELQYPRGRSVRSDLSSSSTSTTTQLSSTTTQLSSSPLPSLLGISRREEMLGTSDHGNTNNNTTAAAAATATIPTATIIHRRHERLRTLLTTIAQQIQSVDQQQHDLLIELQTAAAAANHDTLRPLSRAVWNALPRTILHERSSLFYRASLTLSLLHSSSGSSLLSTTTATNSATTTSITMEAIPAEFGADAPIHIPKARLIVPQSAAARTGKLGYLSIQNGFGSPSPSYDNHNHDDPLPLIFYLERGDGITFARKAWLAQAAGAAAVVIGNHVTEPWPYSMKDTRHESSHGSLVTIPVVMVSQAHGQAMVAAAAAAAAAANAKDPTDPEHDSSDTRMFPPLLCNLVMQRVHPNNHDSTDNSSNNNDWPSSSHTFMDCIICHEPFAVGHSIVRLPQCGHVFHTDCAHTWLSRHATCPYCRQEYPTQDNPDASHSTEAAHRPGSLATAHGGGPTTNAPMDAPFYYG